MGIKLFEFQQEAVKRALNSLNYLLCVRVGGGKTLIAMFYAKLLRKKSLADKIAFACTVSAAVAVAGEFKEKLGMTVPQITTVNQYFEWLDNDEPICIFKHSFFEKLGYDQGVIDDLDDYISHGGKRIALVIDEAHKISNEKGIAHTALQNIRFSFVRILAMTATPWQSGLEQLYGTIRLINPKCWKSRAAFTRDHIVQEVIRVNGKVRRVETVAYQNLKKLREKIAPFTFFYYPKIPLNFIYHNVRLPDYTEYDEICKGVLTEKELERLNKGDKK